MRERGAENAIDDAVYGLARHIEQMPGIRAGDPGRGFAKTRYHQIAISIQKERDQNA